MNRPKVFVIGFNKTATTTIHDFFVANGYKSAHWKVDRFTYLAKVMVSNAMSYRPILSGISRFDVYSDMNYVEDDLVLEANYLFREIYDQHPEAYFLLNTRDMDAWIRSRSEHARPGPDGVDRSFIKRASKAYNQDDAGTIDVWKNAHLKFHSEVRGFFGQHAGARFLDFNINTDGPDKLIDWLKPDYTLDAGKWGKSNVTPAYRQTRAILEDQT